MAGGVPSITQRWVARHLPPRPARAHKGDFGRLLVLAGSLDYPGPALLTALGAFLAAGTEPFAAAVCGVAVHGAAGLTAAERIGTAGAMARDIAALLPEAIE